jgi:hypothetical protein
LLRAIGELYIDEIQMPTSLYFSQAVKRRRIESAYCKFIFQMFQSYVAIVSCGCCKSRSRCCNSCTCMLQAFVLFICFFRRMLQVCLSRCCIRFTQMLQMFYPDVAYVLQCFSSVFCALFQVFQKHVSSVSLSLDVCCKCCILTFEK